MKTKGKGKSTLIFFIAVCFIGLLAYSGMYGLTLGDYRFKSFGEVINRGLDLQGGASVLMEIQQDNVSQETLERTKQLISLRVNRLGVSETTTTTEGNKRIRVELPGKFDSKEIIDTIGKTGELTFKGPDGTVILTGKDVKKATAYINSTDQKPTIGLELNDEGTKKFADATQKYYQQQIAIYMDEDMLTNPVVQAVIPDGKAVITGSKTMEEAQREAGIINSGALPVPIKTASVKIVGPTLGANALPQSVMAGKIGIGLVLLFMILYYRVPGLLSCIALILYIIIVLGAFTVIGATLTLPGIAGFLLTVGMAVDANVLIFERMKEELKSGKSIRSSIDSGFHRAMSSILDSNITTVISGVVLYALGNGPVKGFALTLIIGVVLSMFTAITVSRTLIKLAANMGWFSQKWSIGTFGVHDFRRG